MLKWQRIDPIAKPNSTPTITTNQTFADITDLKDDIFTSPNYATVGELNQTLLDDSQPVFPDDPANYKWGIFSTQLTNASGDFTSPPVLDVSFSQTIGTEGITLYFYDAWATQVIITWYNGTTQLDSKTFNPTSLIFFCRNPITAYTRVVVTFEKSIPYRYLKMRNIVYGQIKVVGDDEITSHRLVENVNESATKLVVNTMNCELVSLEDDFDIVERSGDYELIKTRQPVEDLNGYGTFYVNKFEASGNIIKLGLIDLLGAIGDIPYNGGIFDTTLANFISDIATLCKTTDIFNGAHNGFEVDATLRSVPVKGWIKETTVRDAIHQVCIACGAVLDTTRSDKIKLRPVPTIKTSDITDSEILMDDKTELNEFYTGVLLTAYDIYLFAIPEELSTAVYKAGSYKYQVSEPYGNYQITGGTITESNANFVKFTVPTEQSVTLKGEKYTILSRNFEKNISGLTNASVKKVKELKEMYLVNESNSTDILDRYFNYFTKKYKTDFTILTPKLTGEIYKANGVTGITEKQDIDLVTELSKVVLKGNA